MNNKKLIMIMMFSTLTVFASAAENFKLDQAVAEHFAEDWIASWNAHDMERILSHYTDDFQMTSPNIIRRELSAEGVLQGKVAMRNYWGRAIGPNSQLVFTLVDTLLAIDSLTLYYRNQNGLMAAEVFFFNSEGLVYKAFAHYSVSKPTGS
jgi:ketosteroid isomerase-like protein